MARKKRAPQKDALIDDIQEGTQAAQPDSSGRLRLPMPPTRGTNEASFFQMAGSTCVAFGILIALGSSVAEPIARISGVLNNVGLGGGMLVLAGLILFALGRLRRSHHELSLRAEERASNDQLLERMAVDVVRLNGAVENQQSTGSRLQQSVQEMAGHIGVLGQQVEANGREENKAHDAMFSLAASLDQLGARVDQRMQTQYDAFRARLREVGDDIVGAHTEVRRLLTNEFAGGRASGSLESSAEAQAYETADDAGYESPAAQTYESVEPAAHEPQASISRDPFESNPFGEPEVTSEPDAGTINVSLGVLDQIDDVGETVRPLDNQPHASTPNIYDAAETPPPVMPAAPVQPVDGGTWGEDHQLVREKSPVERAAEIDAQTKLHQLNDLLADQNLREMLENIRRGK